MLEKVPLNAWPPFSPAAHPGKRHTVRRVGLRTCVGDRRGGGFDLAPDTSPRETTCGGVKLINHGTTPWGEGWGGGGRSVLLSS